MANPKTYIPDTVVPVLAGIAGIAGASFVAAALNDAGNAGNDPFFVFMGITLLALSLFGLVWSWRAGLFGALPGRSALGLCILFVGAVVGVALNSVLDGSTRVLPWVLAGVGTMLWASGQSSTKHVQEEPG